MICHWALIEGEMGSFLEAVMDDEVFHVIHCHLCIMFNLFEKEALLPLTLDISLNLIANAIPLYCTTVTYSYVLFCSHGFEWLRYLN